ncbi:manganese transport protein MntH [Saccharibacter floricola DSM 15669]|uniref:Divalent metal cation transporter MntH n=2 Tax=Saccharibacter TaxID=231052 RepID=A0ABQ0NWG3_9PROT|nr:Nramp family divalent metal transporter [Saccharibacter floricola]GBQ05022.1 manganese transport protein MntH [Saccharibacter floricola DSM 15669]
MASSLFCSYEECFPKERDEGALASGLLALKRLLSSIGNNFLGNKKNYAYSRQSMKQNPPSFLDAQPSSSMHPAGLVSVPGRAAFWLRRFLAFVGPGYMVAVGYMDPGNWATDLQGGSEFGYTLLFAILLSNIMAVILQALSARLGVVTDHDLAQACRAWLPGWMRLPLWLTCEVAIIACDLAEVIGTAVALQLLFGFPILVGTAISVLDVFLVLLLMRHGFRWLEAFVMTLLGIIAVCFGIQMVASSPDIGEVFRGFLPSSTLLTQPDMLYIAIGIVGATVMPHNLYLHSSLVQSRNYDRTLEGRKDALRWATWDSTIALTLALFVNAAILIVAAAAFYRTGHHDVAEISDAWRLLSPILGFGLASTLFAVALLAAGTNSTVTGTLAGQIVMEGFLNLRLPYWARRMVTRGLAVLPVVVIVGLYGQGKVGALLVFSQIVLSMQLPFAVIPLVYFVSHKRIMGAFRLSRPLMVVSWVIVGIVVVLNGKLLWDAVF